MLNVLDAADTVRAAAAKGPTRELVDRIPGMPTTRRIGLSDELDEYVPDLRWPLSVRAYQAMRADPQVAALMAAMTLPIRRYRWLLDPQDAAPDVVAQLAEDLGVQVLGQPVVTRRTRGRFSHDFHLRHALLALVYGHAYFQVVGDYPDGGTGRWRLTKLRPEMAHTIDDIQVAEDGGLEGIVKGQTEIPVDRLVAYVWDREGANWAGRSMLRALYQPWFVKQDLLEIDLVKNQRNGMGVPVARETEPGVSDSARKEGLAMASAWRVGRDAGVALPYGMDIDLKAVSGSLPDTLASIRNCDEAMARAGLAMFLQLGQTQTGSRALGESFVDFFSLAQQSVAGWYADVTTEHVIEDWVDYNVGPDAPAPRLIFEAQEDASLSVTDLTQLIDSGALTVDAELEAALRDQHQLPARQQSEAPAGRSFQYDLDYGILMVDERRAQIGMPPLPGGKGKVLPEPSATRDAILAAAGDVPPVAREPTPEEIAAGVDFAAMQAQQAAATDELIAAWQDVQAAQSADLAAQVAAATTAAAAASVVASTAGAPAIAAAMATAAAEGVAAATAEAASQAFTLPAPDTDALAADVLEPHAEAVATILARSLAQAAANHATALYSPDLNGEALAELVSKHLDGLSEATLREHLGSAVHAARNQGRFAAMDGWGANGTPYSSELADLANGKPDPAACQPCRDIDGTSYESMDEARRDYPLGGFLGCEGRGRCRGTIVIVADEVA